MNDFLRIVIAATCLWPSISYAGAPDVVLDSSWVPLAPGPKVGEGFVREAGGYSPNVMRSVLVDGRKIGSPETLTQLKSPDIITMPEQRTREVIATIHAIPTGKISESTDSRLLADASGGKLVPLVNAERGTLLESRGRLLTTDDRGSVLDMPRGNPLHDETPLLVPADSLPRAVQDAHAVIKISK